MFDKEAFTMCKGAYEPAIGRGTSDFAAKRTTGRCINREHLLLNAFVLDNCITWKRTLPTRRRLPNRKKKRKESKHFVSFPKRQTDTQLL